LDFFSFPRAGVGTHSRRANVAARKPINTDAGASGIGSHAGAWEPEKRRTLARPESVPTPARGNQKIEYQFFCSATSAITLAILASVYANCTSFFC